MTNSITILLGLAVGGMMKAADFLRPETVMIYVIRVVAFAVGTAAGVLFGKVLYVASGKKVNPLIGAVGISAFPVCARRAGHRAALLLTPETGFRAAIVTFVTQADP
jgi:carboxybiotin decarboxylase